MEKFYYLFINVAILIFPLILSFDKSMRFYKKFKIVFPTIVIMSALSLFIDNYLIFKKWWWFNEKYVVGFYILKLPIEEYLFFITASFSLLFIFEVVNFYSKIKSSNYCAPSILIILFVVISLATYNKDYTFYSSLAATILCIFMLVMNRGFSANILLTLAFAVFPFLIINSLLTGIPIVLYNSRLITNYRIGSIPIEDFLFNFDLTLLVIIIYNYFESKIAFNHRRIECLD